MKNKQIICLIKRFVRVLPVAWLVLLVTTLCMPASAIALSMDVSYVQIDEIPDEYTGWAKDEADEFYWFDNGVMAQRKEA